MGSEQQQGPPSADIPGPHQLDQTQRVQAAISGPPLWFGPHRSLAVIQDPDSARWGVYPGAVAAEAFWATDEQICRFACTIVAAQLRKLPGGGL